MNLLLCPRLFPHSLLLSPDFLFCRKFFLLLLLKFHSLSHLFSICRECICRKREMENKYDISGVDQIRAGIKRKAIEKIIDFDPEKFLYISCNPVTLVRDLGVFKERAYEIEKIEIVDQFPRTSHVETIALIQKM